MKPATTQFNRTLLFTALTGLLGACGGSDSAATPADAASQPDHVAAAPAPAALSEQQMVDEVAANLQACSYDGSPVQVNPARMVIGVNADGSQVVAEIMKYTGLPQNFDVIEHPEVPNAAAIILMGRDQLPRRVIAYNPAFMNDVRRATADNNWAPISIMAHEIGHHLSGHTIQPGGSQPPTELEADKFSGFVLYKMGAVLADAQKAMSTLVSETGGRTHPGRRPRLVAIEEGWKQACQQQPNSDCSGAVSALTAAVRPHEPATPDLTTAPTPTPTRPAIASAPAPAPVPAPAPAPAPSVGQPLASANGQVDVLPVPGTNAIPAKFDQFIYDELGLLDADIRGQFEQQMYDHAREWGVEIVTLLVKDLHGLSGDDYAQAMLRQLRVGKLDVGNGAVLVIAPEQGEVGIAMGPGVALQMEYHDKKASLQRWLDSGYPECQRKQSCGNWTENFMLAADHIRRDTDQLEWTIRYQSLGELMTAYTEHFNARNESGAGFNPESDPGYQKIARVQGTVVNLNPPLGNKTAFVSKIKIERGRRAVHVQGADGYTVMLYLDPTMQALMPAGALEQGKTYTFITRTDNLSWNPKDTQSFNLLSYDLAQ